MFQQAFLRSPSASVGQHASELGLNDRSVKRILHVELQKWQPLNYTWRIRFSTPFLQMRRNLNK